MSATIILEFEQPSQQPVPKHGHEFWQTKGNKRRKKQFNSSNDA
jgi:hypothetical protein